MDIIYCYSVMFYRFFSFFINYACFRNKFCPISRVVIFFFIIEYNSFYSKCFIRQNRLTNKQETIMKTQLNIVDESLGKINFPKKFFLKKLIRRHSKRDGRQILQKKKKKKEKKTRPIKYIILKISVANVKRDIEIKIENEIRESDFYFPNN